MIATVRFVNTSITSQHYLCVCVCGEHIQDLLTYKEWWSPGTGIGGTEKTLFKSTKSQSLDRRVLELSTAIIDNSTKLDMHFKRS